MADVKLGAQTFSGVKSVKLNTVDNETAVFVRYITVSNVDDLPSEADEGTIAVVGGD